ncbi:MAG: peptidylprolyl isomerase [Candidatus Puniceispirillales bacterium]|jgi:peptidyl-prolyl cis-trans isomerase C|tara:strand:+ start:817 stop:1656 length:840 start_codon:yes stop_codon:yes gene_type:complete
MSCLKKTFIIIKLLFILSFNSAFAQDPNKVIAAQVNDHIISAKDVLMALEKLPSKIKEQPLPSLYPNIVNELINQHLIAQQAYKENLDKNKKVLSEINKRKEQIMAKYWLNSYLSQKLDKKNLKNFYNNYLKSFKSSKEYNASHILVKEEKEALNIIKKLNNKASFSDLAKEFSVGPSGKTGGKLGWFSSGQMVKEFEKATFILNKGQITKEPVKTKFGFHIIKLNDVRISQPKNFTEIEPEIINMIKKKSLVNLEKEIKKNQKIIINKFEDVAKKVNN